MINNVEKLLTNSTGVTVTVISSSFPARQSLSVRSKLFAIILPFLSHFSFPELKAITQGKGLDDPQVILKLIPALTPILSSDGVVPLILELLSFTRINGLEVSKGEVFDSVFTGEDTLLFKVLKFVIVDVNSFLAGAEAGKNIIGAPGLATNQETK